MGIHRIAAVIYSLLTVGIVAFQIAMAAGMPWGAYALFELFFEAGNFRYA
jgi:hypothetical protein